MTTVLVYNNVFSLPKMDFSYNMIFSHCHSFEWSFILFWYPLAAYSWHSCRCLGCRKKFKPPQLWWWEWKRISNNRALFFKKWLESSRWWSERSPISSTWNVYFYCTFGKIYCLIFLSCKNVLWSAFSHTQPLPPCSKSKS